MLVIFEVTDTGQVNFGPEDCYQLRWLEQAPEPGDLVSMGAEQNWQVVKTQAYSPAGLGQPVEQVCFAWVNREGLPTPPEPEWYGNSHGVETTFHVKLAGIGEPELEVFIDYEAATPQVGERLTVSQDTGIASSDFSTLATSEPTDWVIDRFDTYLPGASAPYAAVHLAWCKELALVAA